MVKRAPWLSVTPEPERELPEAVATLACGGVPPADAVARERERVERLVLHGSKRQWLAYLHGVVELIDRSGAGDADPDVAQPARVRDRRDLEPPQPAAGAARARRGEPRPTAAARAAARHDEPSEQSMSTTAIPTTAGELTAEQLELQPRARSSSTTC